MKENKLSYLAGLIDGEGSICISTALRWFWTNAAKTSRKQYHTYQLFVSVTNKSEKLMKWLVRNFGGKYYPKKRKDVVKWAQAWDWQIRGKANKERLLLGVMPYLVVKQEQAKIALEYLRLGDNSIEKREKLRLKMAPLNRRGPSETNTLNDSFESKIESEPHGDMGRDPVVTLES
jgi:hypothetical protein